MNKIKIFFENLPNNTPGFLIRFMALIELVRKIIRPITLAVRLTANITAGHILLNLVTVREKYFLIQVLIQFFFIFVGVYSWGNPEVRINYACKYLYL